MKFEYIKPLSLPKIFRKIKSVWDIPVLFKTKTVKELNDLFEEVTVTAHRSKPPNKCHKCGCTKLIEKLRCWICSECRIIVKYK